MQNNIKSILDNIGALHKELDAALSEKAEQLKYSYENRKVVFKADAVKLHKSFRVNWWRYIVEANYMMILTAPFIYALIVPFFILDVSVSIYQAICFPVYGVKKAKRKDYIMIDRQHLAYLNGIQKINCMYCGYGNGVMAFASEVAARTEAYWCPIKHAGKLAGYHNHYGDFADYGDAEHFHADLERNHSLVQEIPPSDQD